jgi:NTE family protein
MSAFTVVLAAGGERVVAWEVGVLAGLADAGLDPRGAEVVLGTSAGALVAARLAAGEDPRVDAALTEEVAALEAAGRRVLLVRAGDEDLAAMGPDR